MKLIFDKGLNCPDETIQAQWDDICNKMDALYKPDFEKVFVRLFGLDNTLTKNYPCTNNETNLNKALAMAGFEKDEAFCNDFKQYNRLFVEGKAIQAKGLAVMASVIPEFGKQAGGWYFVPISIIAPKEATDIQEAITTILAADAKAGKGLFANVTQIPKEDEALDKYLCVEAYDCKGTFAAFYRTLQRYNVAGKDEALFNRLAFDNDEIPNGTTLLFHNLKQCICIIKENTDSPNRTRNKLNEAVCWFDNIPVWGLLFQMLLLDGLCQMLASLNINEGDSGFDEAQALFDWLAEALLQKEMLFCCQYYGDGDLETLKPLCEYLCTTDTGKAVQDWVKDKYYPEQRETAPEQRENQQAGNDKGKQPEAPERAKNKQRGRKAKPFVSYLLGDDAQKASSLKAFHTLLQDKSGKDAVLIIKAGVKAGKITKPTYTPVIKEFGDIGSQQNFDKYMNNNNAFTDIEIQGAITALENQIKAF